MGRDRPRTRGQGSGKNQGKGKSKNEGKDKNASYTNQALAIMATMATSQAALITSTTKT